MIFTETKLQGAYLIQIERKEDERGYFGRTFCRNEFEEQGIQFKIEQSNVSFNKTKGTLRGMHMQSEPNNEAKLVQCVSGSIYDVIIDMRSDSHTYCQWIAAELSPANSRMIYIPKGFAHGFLTLQDDTQVIYHMSEFYTPGSEKAFRWNDPFFHIEWPAKPVLLSEKDNQHPLVESASLLM